jgi:tetratricopeptide (TPR) repeat protein
MGMAQTGMIDSAKQELVIMNTLRDSLLAQKDAYKAKQVYIQINSGAAWIALKEGDNKEALQLMTLAANMEDSTEKHPVTPGEVLPAKELLGDMLLAMNQPAKALEAYEANLINRPNRFNSLYGAGLSAERTKQVEKTFFYYHQLMGIAKANSTRTEIKIAKAYIRKAAATASAN